MTLTASLASEWSKTLGLVEVELFGASLRTHAPPGQHSALLDGARASFLFSTGVTEDSLESPVRSWTWSAHVQHHLSVDARRSRLVYRRWDTDEPIRLRYPSREAECLKLLASLERAPPARQQDVILHVMMAYRQLVQALGSPFNGVLVLNGILAAGIQAQQEHLDHSAIIRASTPHEIFTLLSPRWQEASGIHSLPNSVTNARLGSIVHQLLSGQRSAALDFNSHIFLRHASSHLYQEAHRDTQISDQLALPGLSDVPEGLLAGTADTHFTPAGLARFIVQRALANLDKTQLQSLRILDPACGSGVFLQEAVRELVTKGYTAPVELCGIDVSPAACSITRFVLEQAIDDAAASGLKITSKIQCANALATDWGQADVILMNPPFQAWPNMDEARRKSVMAALGSTFGGRPDLAMAFTSLAMRALRPGGSLGTVLPAPLLETNSGESWRAAIAQECSFDALGRFASPSFFRGAMVEPSFLICRKGRSASATTAKEERTLFLVAQAGSEDAAIRNARILATSGDESGPRDPGVDVYRARMSLTNANWMPRSRSMLALGEEIGRRGHPTVAHLFDIMQGARTGHKKAFVLDEENFSELPKSEQSYFRPAVLNASIFDGQLTACSYVFYPYQLGKGNIDTERELKKAVPRYFERYLKPYREELETRFGVEDRWWLLSRDRPWQHSILPKLVSTYFGDQGSFALDPKGEFVVVQGFAWIWKKRRSEDSALDAETLETQIESNAAFVRSNYGLAYLAVLNSACFARLLELVSPRVAGGQFNLSKRFAERVRIPNLADGGRASTRNVSMLARLGRRILTTGLASCASEVDEATAQAYGVSLKMFGEI